MSDAQPIRVAYVTMEFPSPSETFASTDVCSLLACGDEVTVFAMRPPHARHDRMMTERSLDGADVRPMTLSRALRGALLLFARPAWTASVLAWTLRWNLRRPRQLFASLALMPSAFVIFDEIRRGGFDVVHLFWGHYPAVVGHLARRFAPRCVRSVFLGAYDLVMAYGGSVPVARSADIVWTHARVNVPVIERLGVRVQAIHVAYRGVDMAKLRTVREGVANDRRAGQIVVVARLIAAKGVNIVIHAFALVRGRIPFTKLTIIGDGPARNELELQAARSGVGDAVEFFGHVPHADVLSILGRSDVFVLLSTDERLSNAVKEAMAMGCVCVVSRTPGIEELVDHERTGYVVDRLEPDHVAGWIERALAEEGREELRCEARLHIEKVFDVAKTMDSYRTEWSSLVARRRRPA